MAAFSPLLDILEQVPDPRRAEGKVYELPHVLLFSILAIVSGCNSYRGIVTFIDVHRQRLNTVFGLGWRRAPAHTAIRYILQGLDPAAVEAAFRRHAGLLQEARQTSGEGTIALDGKVLRGSFDKFHDRAAAGMLSAFATDTADYMLNRWPSFARFLGDGRVCMTNNSSERALRGLALGRKAWLFAGSNRGGQRAAFFNSLIVTTKLKDVDPQAWLADVLGRSHLALRPADLLPWNWRPIPAETPSLDAAA